MRRLLQGQLRGEGSWVRIHGTRGLMENLRPAPQGNQQQLRLHKQAFDTEDGQAVSKVYLPEFPEYAEAAQRAGHGGGDFFTNFHFARAIRGEEAPFWDVYRGVACSIVGILAYRSALNNSSLVEVPDLREKLARDRYRSDDWSPDPATRTAGDPWPSVMGDIRPSDAGLAFSRKVWAERGYVERPGVTAGAGLTR